MEKLLKAPRAGLFLCAWLILTACTSDDPQAIPPIAGNQDLYFPPLTGSQWETVSPASLGWDTGKLTEFSDFLEQTNSRAIIILKDGKIVFEEYYGTNLMGDRDFDQNTNWYWASAAKTLTAFLIGKAQEEDLLDINHASSLYLGDGWTSLDLVDEQKITVWHQLSMSSGLDDEVANKDCTDPECLQYLADPGTRWAYHNGPYTRLDGVIEGATSGTFDAFFESRLKNLIGMDGLWTYSGYNHLYFSTPRSMARFGLLMSNDGVWDETTVMDDKVYLSDMINTSQDINPSYGYLWWLNGKSSYMLPGLQLSFSGSLSPNAPDDLFAAMGKNGQLINIVPSQGLVVVRMGDNPENALVPSTFQDEMWSKLQEVLPESP